MGRTGNISLGATNDIIGAHAHAWPRNDVGRSKFVMATFLSLAVRESARVRHFVHVAMFRIPPFHVRNARAINVSS